MFDTDHYSLAPEWLTQCNREFNAAFSESGGSDYSTALATIDAARRRLVDRCAGDTLKTAIVERAFREFAFSVAFRSHASLEICQDAFSECHKLGFRDLLTEATLTVIYARYCRSCGREDLAVSALSKLRDKLDATLASLVSVRDLVESVRQGG